MLRWNASLGRRPDYINTMDFRKRLRALEYLPKKGKLANVPQIRIVDRSQSGFMAQVTLPPMESTFEFPLPLGTFANEKFRALKPDGGPQDHKYGVTICNRAWDFTGRTTHDTSVPEAPFLGSAENKHGLDPDACEALRRLEMISDQFLLRTIIANDKFRQPDKAKYQREVKSKDKEVIKKQVAEIMLIKKSDFYQPPYSTSRENTLAAYDEDFSAAAGETGVKAGEPAAKTGESGVKTGEPAAKTPKVAKPAATEPLDLYDPKFPEQCEAFVTLWAPLFTRRSPPHDAAPSEFVASQPQLLQMWQQGWVWNEWPVYAGPMGDQLVPVGQRSLRPGTIFAPTVALKAVMEGKNTKTNTLPAYLRLEIVAARILAFPTSGPSRSLPPPMPIALPGADEVDLNSSAPTVLHLGLPSGGSAGALVARTDAARAASAAVITEIE